MGLNRLLGDLAHNLDSAAVGSYQGKSDFATIAYSTLSGTPSIVLDSSLSTQLVDSAYIQARQLPGKTGLDSAAAISVVDSNYINLRIGGGGSGFFVYDFETTAGQTEIKDSDINGNLMSYEENGILVFKNGVLLLDSDDYTATDGSVVTLTSAADSGSNITISKYVLGGGGGSAQNAWSGQRGLIGGGYTEVNGTSLNVINYIDISTTGDAVDFGDLSSARDAVAALSNQTRGVFGGGKTNGSRQNTMDYVTISTTGNATDFGDLSDTKVGMGASSNGTRGIFAGGFGSGSYPTYYKTDIEYITVATTGNATDFGNIADGNQMLTSFADLTRGVIAGGYSLTAAGDNSLQYITFDTTGNTTDFGDLTVGGYLSGSFSDATRGVFGGGSGASFSAGDVIDYVTIQTTGNATDFGDLTVGRETSGMADATRGVFSSGGASPYVNTMDYVTIQTTGNATDFGDNTDTIGRSGTCSGSPS